MRIHSSTALLASLVVIACSGDDAAAPVDEKEALLGGETTIFDTSPNAFAFPARNLSTEARELFSLGDHFFNRTWVTAPASTSANDGLGPTYNATSCSACHFKDGRGAPPTAEGENFKGLLLRLSVPGPNGPVDEPNYGDQFNHLAILGVPAEGKASVHYDEVPGAFGDGEPFSLRKPTYIFSELAFGPMDPNVMVSPRVSPPMIGLGLLESIPEATILGKADPDDLDHDGVSGRPNYVQSLALGTRALGRLGWKCNQVTLEDQTAGAFHGDIGITTRLHPYENCPPIQLDCANAISGGTPEAPELVDAKITQLVGYESALAVPARRDINDVVVRRGESLFKEAKCTSCHTPLVETGDAPGFPALAHQVIRPFTDMLLHDMGEGLADHRPDGEATGVEWRTTPLWGIGLTQTVSKHDFLLHDGRARGIAEAILWHSGEAEAAKERFRTMSREDRAALLRFLSSL